jgi:hypothetical protein
MADATPLIATPPLMPLIIFAYATPAAFRQPPLYAAPLFLRFSFSPIRADCCAIIHAADEFSISPPMLPSLAQPPRAAAAADRFRFFLRRFHFRPPIAASY